MSNRKVNSITYGAIMCALIGVLLLINRQLANYLDIYLFWIIPIPIIIYSVKFGTKQTLVMDLAVIAVSILCTGFSIVTMTYTIASVIAGTAYGYGLNKKYSSGFLIASIVVVSLIVMVLSTFLFASFFGYNVVEEVQFIQQYIIELFSKASAGTGIDTSSIISYDLVLKLFVIVSILSSVLEGVLVHLLAYIVLRRLKMPLPPMKTIAEFYAPKWIKLFVFASLVAYYGAIITRVTQYNDIILVLMMISQVILVGFGYMFIITYLPFFVKSKKAIILIMILLFLLIGISAQLMIILGFIDVFTNTRKNFIERVKASAK